MQRSYIDLDINAPVSEHLRSKLNQYAARIAMGVPGCLRFIFHNPASFSLIRDALASDRITFDSGNLPDFKFTPQPICHE